MKREPCRFCDNKDQDYLLTKTKEAIVSGKTEVQYFVFCDFCGASGPHASTEEKAIQRWNKGTEEKKGRQWRAECKKCGRKYDNWYAFMYCDCGTELKGEFYDISEYKK